MDLSKEHKKERFLSALAAGATVTTAIEMSTLSRSTVYLWREKDEAFRAAWEEAHTTGTDVLLEEAQRRAIHGVRKPQFYKGELIRDEDTGEPVDVREYSDTLLIMLMKARRPEVYCDKARMALLIRKWQLEDDAAGKTRNVPTADIVDMLNRLAANKAAPPDKSAA